MPFASWLQAKVTVWWTVVMNNRGGFICLGWRFVVRCGDGSPSPHLHHHHHHVSPGGKLLWVLSCDH